MLTTDHMEPTNQGLIEATSIGNIASDILSNDQVVSVFGSTSRGIFIKTSTRWLNYISQEPYLGPLTINLSELIEPFHQLSTGMQVRISSKQLIFPDVNLVISTQDLTPWQPPAPIAPPLPAFDRQVRLIECSEMVLKNWGETGLAYLLPELLDLTNTHHRSDKDLYPLHKGILHLQEQMSASQRPPSAEPIIDILGQGSGLTPSSDDFVIGFLLALNHWNDLLLPSKEMQRLNRRIVDAAYEKTTTLSANLIECATLGLADERLIQALDWLVASTSQDSQPIEELLTWGSSSGVDVFVGFVAALTCASEPSSWKHIKFRRPQEK